MMLKCGQTGNVAYKFGGNEGFSKKSEVEKTSYICTNCGEKFMTKVSYCFKCGSKISENN